LKPLIQTARADDPVFKYEKSAAPFLLGSNPLLKLSVVSTKFCRRVHLLFSLLFCFFTFLVYVHFAASFNIVVFCLTLLFHALFSCSFCRFSCLGVPRVVLLIFTQLCCRSASDSPRTFPSVFFLEPHLPFSTMTGNLKRPQQIGHRGACREILIDGIFPQFHSHFASFFLCGSFFSPFRGPCFSFS